MAKVVLKETVPAVRLTDVSKSFTLARSPDARSGLFSFRRPAKPPETVFWALKDISFEIGQGRALGILGLNGAGKSTLLNLVAETLMPTQGSVEVNGRVQFLQLGAGFVRELTARQNVVAHGRARGVGSAEIDRRVAYVEGFADIGPFFDQPMQNYSSGMYARVAFGNAFAVDPEILIVDEALAVGDAAFVNKCFRKIQEIRDRGTTILFTSHSSDAILRLCDDGVVLHKGGLVEWGSARDAVKAYSNIVLGDSVGSFSGEAGRIENVAAMGGLETAADDVDSGTGEREPQTVLFRGSDGIDLLKRSALFNPHEMIFGQGGARIVECVARVGGKESRNHLIPLGADVELFFRVQIDQEVPSPNFGFTVNDERGAIFYGVNQLWSGHKTELARAGDVLSFRVAFPARLAGGDWFITAAIADGLTVLQQREAVLHFKVVDDDRSYIGNGWLDLSFTRLENEV